MSTSAGRKSLLAYARAQEILEIAEINEVKFIKFGELIPGNKVTAGVQGLGACSVIVLVSDHGAIVAHIGPNNELGSNDPRSFLKLANDKMGELEEMYRTNMRYFGPGSHVYLIYAIFQGTLQAPEQMGIYRSRLKNLGLPIVGDRAYERPAQQKVGDCRPEGTVWVVKRENVHPAVYLEDKFVSPDFGPTSSGPAQVGASQSSSPLPVASSSTLSRPVFEQQLLECYWVRRERSRYYALLSKSGNVLQQSNTPPQDVWIRELDKNNAALRWIFFDGERWHLR